MTLSDWAGLAFVAVAVLFACLAVAATRRSHTPPLTGSRCVACGFGVAEAGGTRCTYCRRRGLHAIR